MASEQAWNEYDLLTAPDSLADTALIGKADGSGYRLALSAFVSLSALAVATQAMTLTTKTIALGSNTVSGTKAQFNAAVTDGDIVYVGDVIPSANVNGLVAALAAKADLVGGKIPSNQLPALAITDTFVINTQAAMLALTAQVGDVAVRSDLSKSFILKSEPATTLSNWTELLTPANAVLSVAGKTGAVTLAKADVGLGSVDNTSDAGKPVSTAQQAALNAKQNKLTPGSGITIDNSDPAAPVISSSGGGGVPSGTKAQFNTALTDGDFRFAGDAVAQADVTGLTGALNGKLNTTGGTLTGAVLRNFANSVTGASPGITAASNNFWVYANVGNFSLAADGLTTASTMVIQITNAATGAGAMNTTGFDTVGGDTFDSTPNAIWLLQIINFGFNGKKHLMIKKLTA